MNQQGGSGQRWHTRLANDAVEIEGPGQRNVDSHIFVEKYAQVGLHAAARLSF